MGISVTDARHPPTKLSQPLAEERHH